jgi:hypothetical protein
VRAGDKRLRVGVLLGKQGRNKNRIGGKVTN